MDMFLGRALQMRELTDCGRLELPGRCPWCDGNVTVKELSLYMQLWNYAEHTSKSASCVCSYTVELDKDNQPKGQVIPTTRQLLPKRTRREQRVFTRISPWCIYP